MTHSLDGQEIDRIVGANIRKWRVGRGLGIEQAAAACDIDVSDFAKMEDGATRVDPSELIDIASALQVQVTDLFDSRVLGFKDSNPSQSA